MGLVRDREEGLYEALPAGSGCPLTRREFLTRLPLLMSLEYLSFDRPEAIVLWRRADGFYERAFEKYFPPAKMPRQCFDVLMSSTGMVMKEAMP